MNLQKVHNAATVFKYLNGILNIYKPAGIPLAQVKSSILHGICRDMNDLDLNTKSNSNFLITDVATSNQNVVECIHRNTENKLSVHDYAMFGARYDMQDFYLSSLTSLGKHSSGLVLLGLRSGSGKMPRLGRTPLLRVYHVTGSFGTATENFFSDSLITAKSGYYHVRPNVLNTLVSSMQASHQRRLFEMHGVDLQSQAAYDIACRGLLPPADNTLPIIYGLKLIAFERPSFTLEVHVMFESEMYLAALINDLALEARTVAYCTAIRCIRVGQYRVDHSLLRHGWKLSGIVKNLQENHKKIRCG